ncbi:restriction endonuclease subunit S [Vibrio splendidus]|uniref:restriction endonuclease subunit S n=1 Tax=Vibrio splendidus TaxID=29497 RepID=UPI0011B6C6F1|nr:restriction endonuclease subunit S [Vibrio splendidus]
MSNALKLGDVAVVKGGSGFPEKYQGGSHGLPFIKVSDMNLPGNQRYIWKSNNYLNTTVYNLLRPTVFPRDTVVFAKVGAAVYLNKRRILTEDTAIDNNLMGVTATAIEPLFLYYLLQSIDLAEWVQPGALPSINQTIIEDLPIPITDRKQQRYISEVLNAVDNQIDATQALIDKYTAIKQGVMADLFSRGIDPETKALRPTFEEAPELYYKTPLGILPKGWDIAPFEQLSEVIDPNPSHRYPDSVSIDGVPIASTENFEGTDGFNLVKSKLVPDSEFEKQFERCKYQKDDVIFARKGRIGFARQYGDAKKVFSHTVVVMKAKAGVSQDFLLWLARSTQYLEAIDFKMNSNSGVPTLGVDVIKRVRVAVPSVEEQQDIAKCLNQINKKIHTELAFLAKTKAQKSGLMQDLLTGKVPVAA